MALEELEAGQGIIWVRDIDIRWKKLVGPRLGRARLENVHQPHEIRSVLESCADEPCSLYLWGPASTGKSYAAHAVGQRVHASGRSVASINPATFLDSRRPHGPKLEGPSPFTADLLLLEDLGVEKSSDWTDQELFALIDHRWRHEVPTITTSNLSPDEQRDAVGERVWERLQDGAVIACLGGASRRLMAGRAA